MCFFSSSPDSFFLNFIIMLREGNFMTKSFIYDVIFSCLYSPITYPKRKNKKQTKNQHTYFNWKPMPLIEMQVVSTIFTLKAFLGLLPSSKAIKKQMYGTIFLLSAGEYEVNVWTLGSWIFLRNSLYKIKLKMTDALFSIITKPDFFVKFSSCGLKRAALK